MSNLYLNIANYIIQLNSQEINLVPGRRFQNYLVRDSSSINKINLKLNVFKWGDEIPSAAIKVFQAPFVQETGGIRINRSPEFWSVWKDGDTSFIKVSHTEGAKHRNAILKFSLDSKEWDLWIEGSGDSADPLEYPLDGLILYYLTVINGDILIHASGVNYNGKGYIFSGVSGKGKTTMAKIWDVTGAKVIHDDRLIIRLDADNYIMHNTPVYDNEEPRFSALNSLYLIEHGTVNRSVPMAGAPAISLIMANCIQHNWNPFNIERLLGSVSGMCSRIPVYRLEFIPDKNVIDHILANE